MTADPSSPDGGPPTTASAAILLVDDTAAKRLSLRAVLTSLGHEIVEADSGQAALRCLLQRQFAVILLDVRMPLMNGFETAAFIRQRRESEFTPIIFVTAYELPDDDRANPLVAGAVDFITMPVNPEELRAKVSVFVNLFIESQAVESKFQSAHAEVDNWRVLLDNIPIGIFRTDDELRVLYTNADWSALTGLCAGAAYGRTPQDLLGVAAFVPRGPGDDDVDQEVRITSPDA
ncbi:MAG: response regulator, partial [Ilumatobacteraceae bacterium]